MAGRTSLVAALLVFLLAIQGHAAWTVTASETENATTAGAEHRHISLTSDTGGDATIDVALFSAKSANVRVIDNPGRDNLAGVMRRVRGVAGANGGYFDPQDLPVGLVIADGKLLAPFRKARLLSGGLIADKKRIDLLRSAEYSSRKNVTTALQCGPFLVDAGIPVPGLNAIKPARRTFFFTSGSDRAGLGSCSPVTLAELGEILATPRLMGDLKVQRALNFDGGSSSAFWFAGKEGPFSIGEYKTVRNFVVITPK